MPRNVVFVSRERPRYSPIGQHIMATATATRTTKTTTKTTTTPVVSTSLDVAGYVAIEQAEQTDMTKYVAGRARIVGIAIANGSELGNITNTLRAAIIDAGLTPKASLGPALKHYADAYSMASVYGVTLDDKALHASYSVNTGKVPAKLREAFKKAAPKKAVTPADFIKRIDRLKADAVALKGSKAGLAAAPVSAPSEPDDTDESTVGLSMVDDAKAILKQLAAMLKNASDDDAAAIHELVSEFCAEQGVIAL